MGEYRLSLKARADLLNIYAFTDARFGRYQAEAYHAGFERTFGLLAEFPGIGIGVDELAPGYRRFRHRMHSNIRAMRSRPRASAAEAG